MDLRKGSVGDERGEARARGYYASVLTLLCVTCLLVLAGCSDEIGEARKLETQGDIVGALDIYSEVLKGDADNLEALNGGAVCLLMLKRFDEALALQERLVQLDPTDAQIRVELGFNYLNHQARPADAVRVLAEAVRLDPVAKNLCFLAQAQDANGDTRVALGDTTSGHERGPQGTRIRIVCWPASCGVWDGRARRTRCFRRPPRSASM